MKIRPPAVAGSFYPSTINGLTDLVQQFLFKEKDKIDYPLAKKKIIGGVVPHAGYVYSGCEAVHFYEIVSCTKQIYDTVIIMTPNHTGIGQYDVGVAGCEFWETPLGKVAVDTDFIEQMQLPVDSIVHKYEHAGEVQIPFLQIFLGEEFQIVPIAFNQQRVDVARKVAMAIVRANNVLEKSLLLVASSDFSHYLAPHIGKKRDELVLQAISSLNAEMIYQKVTSNRISVCGYGPIMTLVEYARLVSDSPKVNILRRGHSGEISPSDSVVDYISILIYEE